MKLIDLEPTKVLIYRDGKHISTSECFEIGEDDIVDLANRHPRSKFTLHFESGELIGDYTHGSEDYMYFYAGLKGQA